MKKRMLCCLLALVLAVGLLSACGSGKAAVYVQSVAALTGYGSLGGANASSGVVVAQKEIKVDRDSSRKVKQLNVEVGQEVKTGEVLFTYDMEDMQLTIDKAKLEIEQMKNNPAREGKEERAPLGAALLYRADPGTRGRQEGSGV